MDVFPVKGQLHETNFYRNYSGQQESLEPVLPADNLLYKHFIPSLHKSDIIIPHYSIYNRYVREWIGAMVCGDIVDHAEVDGVDRYWLAPHRHSTLTKSGNWSAQSAENLTGIADNCRNVENCFPSAGPLGNRIITHVSKRKLGIYTARCFSITLVKSK